MIKKILLAIMIALPAFGFAQGRFGMVDVSAVFEAMPETAAFRTDIENSSKKYEDEFKKLQDEFQRKYTDFQALMNDTSTPDAIKERRMQEMQELDQKIQQFRSTAAQDLQRQQEQGIAPIQEKIANAIKAVGDEGGYTFIFENGAAAYSGKDVVDVTSAVKAKLGIR